MTPYASLALLVQLTTSAAFAEPLAMPGPPAGMHRLDVPMPPPPPGMHAMPSEETPQWSAVQAPEVDAPDDPEVAKKVEEQSAEMEELRALEEVALDPQAKPNAALLQAMRRLGFGNPLRHRLECAFDELDLRNELLPGELSRVTDLARFDVSLVKDQYDIPVVMQPLVAQYIQFFQGPGRKWFRNWMSRSTRYIPMMTPILEQHSMPKDTVFLAMIESGFSPQALSWAKAAGPWQFIPATGKQYGLKQDFWVDERRDPLKATHAAAKYLSRLHQDLGDWYLAWAGYNAGGNALRRMVNRRGSNDFWSLSEGKGLAKETKHYVPKLIACAIVAKNPRAFGFSDEEFIYQKPLEFDEVQIDDAADLEILARTADVPVESLKELNPELKRWCTPPASTKSPYTLRVPKGAGSRFAENFGKLGPSERLNFKVHRVRRGDTLSVIASTYKSAPEAIMRMNGLRSSRSLKLNTDLVVPVPSPALARSGRADSVLDRQVVRARRGGFSSVRPEEEVPAGTQTRVLAQGPVKTEVIGGKTRVTYGVQSGDSLWVISQRFNCSVEDLQTWNSVPRGKKALKVGSLLYVFPGAKAPGTENRAGTVVATSAATPARSTELGKKMHTLTAGESLGSVAKTYGVSVEDLMKWNGLKSADLKAGQALVVEH